MRQRFAARVGQARALLITNERLRSSQCCCLRVISAPCAQQQPTLLTSCHAYSTEPPAPSLPSFGARVSQSATTHTELPSTNADVLTGIYTQDEIKNVVCSFLPRVPYAMVKECDKSKNMDGERPPGMAVQTLLRLLPTSLRKLMETYARPKGTPVVFDCVVWNYKATDTIDEARNSARRLLERGLGAFMVDRFPEEFIVIMPGARLARKFNADETAAEAAEGKATSENKRGSNYAEDDQQANVNLPLSETANAEAHSSAAGHGPISGSTSDKARNNSESSGGNSNRSPSFGGNTRDMRGNVRGTAPPPPPQPLGPSQRYGANSSAGTSSFFGGLSVGADGVVTPKGSGTTAAEPFRTSIQILDALVEFIPTFYISIEEVAPQIPSAIQQLYSDANLRFFLKRFKHYIDIRTQHNATEVRLRPNFDHPKRGAADARYRAGGDIGTVESLQHANQLRRPPRNSEANLIGVIAPQVPKAFTPLAEVLQDIAPIVSRHPAFDARLGVTGLLGKYPEYFQITDGQLRARPYRVAPNSVNELDRDTSPMPQTYAKVLACVEAAAEGKNYADPAEKAAAMVSTGRLYSLLSSLEKTEVKQKCRSFPTFLRMHGKDLVVSVDKMRVYKFIPEHEACVETLLDDRLRMNSLDPNDPILKIPAEMAAESNAEWAVRELYDALPLMQCAELDEVLSLVPPAVRDALPREVAAVRTLLESFPDYFTLWPYPDDESVVVVQRAKVQQPVLDKAEIVRMVVPLIPQGGTTLTSLRTRAPLQLQRYFYRHGTVATLGAMKDVFAIAGERIVRLV